MEGEEEGEGVGQRKQESQALKKTQFANNMDLSHHQYNIFVIFKGQEPPWYLAAARNITSQTQFAIPIQ